MRASKRRWNTRPDADQAVVHQAGEMLQQELLQSGIFVRVRNEDVRGCHGLRNGRYRP